MSSSRQNKATAFVAIKSTPVMACACSAMALLSVHCSRVQEDANMCQTAKFCEWRNMGHAPSRPLAPNSLCPAVRVPTAAHLGLWVAGVKPNRVCGGQPGLGARAALAGRVGVALCMAHRCLGKKTKEMLDCICLLCSRPFVSARQPDSSSACCAW